MNELLREQSLRVMVERLQKSFQDTVVEKMWACPDCTEWMKSEAEIKMRYQAFWLNKAMRN